MEGFLAYSIDPTRWIPAPGQAALGIETTAGGAVEDYVRAQLDHASTHRAVDLERALMARFEAGCHAPFGAWAVLGEDTVTGREVAVRKGSCVVIWLVAGGRPMDVPLDLGDHDPDAGRWTLERALVGLPAQGVLTADIDTVQGTITCELYPDQTYGGCVSAKACGLIEGMHCPAE